jgi:hypothetical protein
VLTQVQGKQLGVPGGQAISTTLLRIPFLSLSYPNRLNGT